MPQDPAQKAATDKLNQKQREDNVQAKANAAETLTPAQKEAKAAENKAAKVKRFKEVASKRGGNIINSLGVLGNCSNTNNYSYTPEQIEKLFTAIETATKNAKAMFAANAGKDARPALEL